eukprot:6172780-Pleurochrysis_carterae.AAC.2
MSEEDAAGAPSEAELEAGGGRGAQRQCEAFALSGVPVREELWAADVCGGRARDYSSDGDGDGAVLTAAPPLLVPRVGRSHLDALFLVSSGLVTCLDETGAQRWAVQTEARWEATTAVSACAAAEERADGRAAA